MSKARRLARLKAEAEKLQEETTLRMNGLEVASLIEPDYDYDEMDPLVIWVCDNEYTVEEAIILRNWLNDMIGE